MKFLKSFLRWVTRLLVLCAVLAGAAYGGRAVYFANQTNAGGPQYKTAKVTRGDVSLAVTASGQLNPVVLVEVGSQISGNIQKLFVDYNSPVKAGDLIAQIDPGTYEANFAQAEGNLAKAKAELELARINANRAKKLHVDKLNPEAEYDAALGALHQAEAEVKINEGVLKKAQVDLSRCKIYSPVDGVVVSRNVNVGQTVAASLSAPTLFIIANDLSKMQIEADVAEADIGGVEEGQDAEFTVDALPGQTFHGKVKQIRNVPKADQNVVVYVTVIEAANPNLKLKPGMTANVSIVVARRPNVLKVANAALRFRPSRSGDDKKSEMVSLATQADKKSKVLKVKKDKRSSERTVYVLKDGAPEPIKVKAGITDGRDTELIEGLKEGDAVVVDMTEPKENGTMFSRLLSGIKKL